jgi:DNA-binding beta-propeller fold protein YncE
MTPLSRIALVLGCVTLLGGCVNKSRLEREEPRPVGTPVGLLLEKEISGRILGKDLSEPFSLAVDPRGSIFLVDAGNDRVVRFDRELTPQRDIGGRGTREGLFDDPQHLTVDQNLTLWLVDQGNLRLCRYSERLMFLDVIDLRNDAEPLQIRHPSGIAVTDFGEAWVTDRDNNRVVLLDNLGRFRETVGGFGFPGGQMREPAKIITDRDNNMYVCDAGNGRVVIYDESGGFIREIAGEGLISPQAAAFDPSGYLWVLDGQTGRIHQVLGGDDMAEGIGPIIGGELLPLNNPRDIAFMSDHRILIADTGNDRLLLCRILLDADQ